MHKKSKLERGQILLIVVLVLVIGLVVGLSVATRSITNLRVSTEEENSQRAFSAAEAGVEQLLKTGSSSLNNPNLGNNASFTATTNRISGQQILVNGGKPVLKDDGVDVWLSTYPTYATPLTWPRFLVAWGEPGVTCTSTPQPAAVEIIVISGPIAAPTSRTYAYDPCPRNNNFNNLSGGTQNQIVNGKTFQYATDPDDIQLTNALLVRIIPLYANAPIGVMPCDHTRLDCAPSGLPEQGSTIESIGRDLNSSTTRKIAVFQGHPKLPNEFFQYSFFSP